MIQLQNVARDSPPNVSTATEELLTAKDAKASQRLQRKNLTSARRFYSLFIKPSRTLRLSFCCLLFDERVQPVRARVHSQAGGDQSAQAFKAVQRHVEADRTQSQ